MADRTSQEVIEVALDIDATARISQEVIEVMLCNPASVRISQIAIEVILCSGALSLACPVGGGTAQVGVPYSGQIRILGDGTPPYAFKFV